MLMRYVARQLSLDRLEMLSTRLTSFSAVLQMVTMLSDSIVSPPRDFPSSGALWDTTPVEVSMLSAHETSCQLS